jgi:hypothetical protein
MPRSIGSAMKRPMSSARPVMTPSTPRSSAAMTGSGPMRATIRSASRTSSAVSPRRQLGAGAGRDDRLVAGDRREKQVAVDLGTDHPDVEGPAVPGAQRVERVEAGVEMRVRPRDAEREHERHTVLDRGTDVGLDVGRLVRRHLLSGPQPVRTPVAAGALRHDDVDAPLEGPRDVASMPARGRCG